MAEDNFKLGKSLDKHTQILSDQIDLVVNHLNELLKKKKIEIENYRKEHNPAAFAFETTIDKMEKEVESIQRDLEETTHLKKIQIKNNPS